MNTLKIALKEWNLLCEALLSGEQAILLRKGGILESANEFELEQRRFLLFPTFVHQDPAGVKPAWRVRIAARASEPEQVRILGWAEAAGIFEVPSRAALERLDDLHFWAKPLLDMRFAYRPEKPLYLVVVRAFRLPAAVLIANTPAYAGCKSWVPLEEEIDLRGSRPALPEERLAGVLARVREALAG